jgi:hypothetical protein
VRCPPILAVLALALPLCGRAAGETPLLLTSNGTPRASIVIGAKATAVETFAAEELQKYLKAISGAELPVLRQGAEAGASGQILLGTPDSNQGVAALQVSGRIQNLTERNLGFDGYLIQQLQAGDRGVLLLGSHQPRGLLFAVYGFLEECLGVRFYGFGQSEEIIPAAPTIGVAGGKRLRKPQFKFRIANDNNFAPTNRQMLVQTADWAAKNRFNTFLLSLDDVAHVATEELSKRGMEIWGGGHVWGQFTPDKSLFEGHPEYFPLINGKRNFTGDKQAISFCYANADARRIFVSKALAYARQRPMATVFVCWPQDGSQHWAQCQCAECKRFTFSDWNLTMANAIAQAFEADPTLRGMRVQWIAYDEASVPPVHVLPYQRGKNLDLLYANTARDYLAPMDSPVNRKCADWLRPDKMRVQINTDFKEHPTDDDLAGYQRLDAMLSYLQKARFEGNVNLLEYVNAHIGYWLDLPYLQNVQTGPWDLRVFPKDMRFYRARGLAGWSDCFDWPNDFPDPFWNRLLAQLLWDPAADVGEIQRDFYSRYYGAAGATMQSYFEEAWRLLHRAQPAWDDYGSFKALRGRLLQAQQAARGDSLAARHVDKATRWHDLLRLAKSSSNLIEDGSFESADLPEGKSRVFKSVLPEDATQGWQVVHPSKGAVPQAADGRHFLRCSSPNGALVLLSSNYVFEANTIYKLEVQVFPGDEAGALELAAGSTRSNHVWLALTARELAGLKKGQWNHVALEWHCRPGAAEEGRPITVRGRGLNGAAIDHVVLKASLAR